MESSSRLKSVSAPPPPVTYGTTDDPLPRGDDEVGAVVECVRRLSLDGERGPEVELLRDTDRAADFGLDADEAGQVHGEAAAEPVVAERRLGGLLGEEDAAARAQRELDARRFGRR